LSPLRAGPWKRLIAPTYSPIVYMTAANYGIYAKQIGNIAGEE
jgi:hypothetical protein